MQKNAMSQNELKQSCIYINWSKLNDPDTLTQYCKTVDTILMMDQAIKPGDTCPLSLSTAVMMAAKTLLLM
jgi:hypothetical protein